jgi:hypothetical protein
MLVFLLSSTSERLMYSAQRVPAGRNAIKSDVNVVCRPTTADRLLWHDSDWGRRSWLPPTLESDSDSER